MSHSFTLPEAEAMVPLVRQILTDIAAANSTAQHLRRRRELLFECRSSENYEVRKQYYQATDLLAQAERDLDHAYAELEDLGVALLEAVPGVAGFPFRCSSSPRSKKRRQAFFLLKLSDNPERGIWSWQFQADGVERRIPPHWHEVEATPPSRAGGVGSSSEA